MNRSFSPSFGRPFDSPSLPDIVAVNPADNIITMDDDDDDEDDDYTNQHAVQVAISASYSSFCFNTYSCTVSLNFASD